MATVFYEMVSKFLGSFPNVPIADGVQLEELTNGDTSPMFVTLPIMKVDVRSRNGRLYDREQVERIRDQINTKRPVGEEGHLRDEDRAHKFTVPPLRWVGAVLEADGTLWGKAYVLASATNVREYLRTAKAANAKVGTSIYGTAREGKKGEVLDLEIESIDLVHPDRVGVLQAAANPMISREAFETGTLVAWGEGNIGVLVASDGDIATVRPVGDEMEAGDEISLSMSDLNRAPSDVSEKYTKKGKSAMTVEKELNQKPTSVLDESAKIAQIERAHQEAMRAKELQLMEAQLKVQDFENVARELGNPKDVVLEISTLKLRLEQLKKENAELLQETIAASVAKSVKLGDNSPLTLLIASMVKAANPATRIQVNQELEKTLLQPTVKALLAEAVAQAMPNQPTPAPIGEVNTVDIGVEGIYIP